MFLSFFLGQEILSKNSSLNCFILNRAPGRHRAGQGLHLVPPGARLPEATLGDRGVGARVALRRPRYGTGTGEEGVRDPQVAPWELSGEAAVAELRERDHGLQCFEGRAGRCWYESCGSWSVNR